jgi:N-methylhydantoinase A/oxoprolinase/acetone carboxylase beta subunit
VLATAQGIVDIANANMEKAIRVISIERGFDPRDFALFSFGGAGGMHAADMAAHLRMGAVLVPANAGVLSALGLLLADSVKDYSHSVLRTLDLVRFRDLDRACRDFERRGLAEMRADGFAAGAVTFERSLDMRYLGQSYEINVPFGGRSTAGLRAAFDREHRRLYAYVHPDAAVEIVNVRIKIRGRAPKIRLRRYPVVQGGDPARAIMKTQPLHHAGREYRAPVYDRSGLFPGARLAGPALVVDAGSTTFLPPDYGLLVDRSLNLILRKDARR